MPQYSERDMHYKLELIMCHHKRLRNYNCHDIQIVSIVSFCAEFRTHKQCRHEFRELHAKVESKHLQTSTTSGATPPKQRTA